MNLLERLHLSLGVIGALAIMITITPTTTSATPISPIGITINPRQYWPDPFPSDVRNTPEQCVEASLTNPSWDIYGPTLTSVNASDGGTIGDVQFQAYHHATGILANCTANNIELDPQAHGPEALSVWHNCSVPNLQFQFLLADFDMRLRGSWVCGNSSRTSLVFAANGSWEPPLVQGCLDEPHAPRGQETLCIMGNSRVAAGLSRPLAINPQLPLRPYTPQEPAQRCVDRSYDPQWRINSLVYRHHGARGKTGAGGGGGAGGSSSYELDLDLTNLSDNGRIRCEATGDVTSGGNNNNNGSAPWVRCLVADASGEGSSSNGSWIEVSIDTEYGMLGVRQDWGCSDGIEGLEPDHYTGLAYAHLNLSCTNPSRSSGTIDSDPDSDYTCTLPAINTPLTFTGYSEQWRIPLMPHTYYTRSCTIRSLTNTTAIQLQDYQLDSIPDDDADGDLTTTGSFTLYNPGPGDTYRLHRMPVVDDGEWHDCVAGEGKRPIPWQLVGCSYLLDRSSHRVGFRVEWYCDDRDPSHAVLFNATVEKQLPGETCETGADRKQSCRLPSGVTEVALSVSSLTWTTSAHPMDRGPTLPWI